MISKEDRAKYWKSLYEIYCDECEEQKEEPLEEYEFQDRLEELVRETAQDGGFE